MQITVLSSQEEVHDRLVGSAGSLEGDHRGPEGGAEGGPVREHQHHHHALQPGRHRRRPCASSFRWGSRTSPSTASSAPERASRPKGITYPELAEALTMLKRIADESEVKLIWYTPTPYHELNPINHGLGIKQCTACSLNMAIEPDGTVLPCQSYYRAAGQHPHRPLGEDLGPRPVQEDPGEEVPGRGMPGLRHEGRLRRRMPAVPGALATTSAWTGTPACDQRFLADGIEHGIEEEERTVGQSPVPGRPGLFDRLFVRPPLHRLNQGIPFRLRLLPQPIRGPDARMHARSPPPGRPLPSAGRASVR